MGKLVVLKLGDGSFEQGFPVTLQIGEDGQTNYGDGLFPVEGGIRGKAYASLPSVEITGSLPAASEIPQYYSCWATTYRRLGWRSRLEAKTAQVVHVSKLEDCYSAAESLRNRLNAWLQSESFRPIREKLLEQLFPAEMIRVLIQTENSQLKRLPWHLWDFCDRYPKAEIALSATEYEWVDSPTGTKVRILAILGNSTGINTQADRALLEQLPDAEIHFMVEPEYHELNEQLWKQGWDILFFAGHSSSQTLPPSIRPAEETGRIYINQTESLTIDQLKYALKRAVARGLKIAIFNSCDGLGLARDLASLQIPQVIVMREPVPDRVAQEFLKSFLDAFSRGEPFYLAVREARERLQGLEAQFPCATWLPIICQNPAVMPPTWQELCDRTSPPLPIPPSPPEPPSPPWQRLFTLLIASLIVTAGLMGIRHVGMLQPWELQAFDQLMRLRPQEKQDPRLLLITVTEPDFQLSEQKNRKGSLSDLALLKLLKKLESFKPRAIGLDIHRDDAVDPNYPELATYLQGNDRFFAICKVSDVRTNEPGVAPPPGVPQKRQGFNDLVVDADGVIRRHLIAMKPSSTSPCTTRYALSARLVFQYLKAENISVSITETKDLQVGKVVLKRWRNRMGGYQRLDDGGYQILLNYRSAYGSPLEIAEKVTLKDVLTNRVNPDAMKDRIILIGVTAQSAGDFHPSPYSVGRDYYQQMPGVVVHAQMVSQILSAVLDQRPLLWVMSIGGEFLWIWGWSLLGGILAWRSRHPLGLAVAGTVALGTLYGLSFALIIQGGWVPLVPSALALVITGTSVIASTASSPVKTLSATS